MKRALLGFAILSVACAHAPDAELELVASRVDEAGAVGATVYAGEPFQRAETALARARTLTEEGNYLGALHAAGEAVTHADEAFTVATMGKRVAHRDVDRCLSELEGLMAIAESRGAPRDELAAFRERYQAVQAIAASGDLLAALDQGSRLKPELLAFEQRFRDTTE